MRGSRRLAAVGLGTVMAAWILGGTALAADSTVRIESFTFMPGSVTVNVGDTVTWRNYEKRVSHSVLFKARGEESERFFPGEKWSRTFPEAGRFEYSCGPHPEMLGVVIVE